MNDYWTECFDPKVGMQPKDFERTFCRVCKNPTCSRSATQGMSWTRRMATQMERLFVNPSFADPNDPRYAEIRKVDFPSAVREAMRLEISDRRGDWTVPTEEDATRLAATMVAKTGTVEVPAPTPAAPVENVVQQFTIRGTQGDEYEVSLVEVPGASPKWRCTCKAFEFGGGKPCKHITYAATLPPEDEPEPEPQANAPTRFQSTQAPTPARPPQPATVPPAPPKQTAPGQPPPRTPFFPPMGNIPTPPGGIMIDGTRPTPPRDRGGPAAKPAVDPWAPPPPKPKVIPVGGKVVLGGGGEKK